MLEIVVPSVRQKAPERLVYSLSRGTVKPDLVTIVSNETQPFETYGLEVRILGFGSKTVAYGSKDVALRCNIGIWGALLDQVIIQSDDQIASPSMIYWAKRLLDEKDYFWANHRVIDFDAHTVDEIINLDGARNVSRETPTPPARHGYYSCYSGMLGFRRDFMVAFGGIDMAFNGRHGGEDQQLGLRLMKTAGETSVMIHEPPYGWIHDRKNTPEQWLPQVTNVCSAREYEDVFVNGVTFQRCRHCPETLHSGPEDELFTGRLILPFDSTQIEFTT